MLTALNSGGRLWFLSCSWTSDELLVLSKVFQGVWELGHGSRLRSSGCPVVPQEFEVSSLCLPSVPVKLQ